MTGAAERFVRVEQAGHVAVVTLDRPDRLNAMGDTMDEQFWEALEEVFGRDDVRVVLWRAEGRAFSAGRDLNDLGVRPEGTTDFQYISQGHARTHELLVPPPVAVVVAIQGWCIGGSFERALLCDIRIAADDAKFRLPELSHGLIPDSGGTARIFQMCGHGLAADLVLTGRVMDAQEALRHGVVSRVVPRAELDEQAMSVAAAIAEQPPLAVRMHRQVIGRLATGEVAGSLREELLAQMLVYKSEDFAELKSARSEGRDPKFRGT
ncbi:MAG: enoyl-CoA hydratase/isomerase family protein [Acidimicrobiales bacterium]